VDVAHERERGRGVGGVAHGFFESQERVVNRPVFLRSLCDRVEARAGVPECLFALPRDPAICIAGLHRLLRVGRRERVRLPAGGYRFCYSCREILGREIYEGYEDEEDSDSGVEGVRGMRLLGTSGDKGEGVANRVSEQGRGVCLGTDPGRDRWELFHFRERD